MKKFLLPLLLAATCAVQAQDTLSVRPMHVPVLINRDDNSIVEFKFDNKDGANATLSDVSFVFDKNTDLSNVKSVKLYYAGTEAVTRVKDNHHAAMQYISREKPGKTHAADPAYSMLKAKVDAPKNKTIHFDAALPMVKGVNFFWISLEMNENTPLTTKVAGEITEAKVGGKEVVIKNTATPQPWRMGTGVRYAGDDNAAAYRIPGMVTSKKGTLLAVYDVRYNNSADLQEHVDVGLNRSFDGGQTWEPLQIIMDMGEYGGLPEGQNGIGDPAILVDDKTGTIWVVAAWTHGMGNMRAWFNSQAGMEPIETAQLMLVKSEDDGKTWSKPINITKQVKDPSWKFLLQGPGMGITMQDGTLVFPIQFIDSTNVPNAGVMYSKDRGNTWKIHNLARTNTTEAQVAEVEPGVLMLNMRDNRGGSRAVATTKDLGKTWTEHVSSRSALREPVCMASLIASKRNQNSLKKDLLIFSNPDTEKQRKDITIKVSLDGGVTWLPQNQVLLDEGYGWGYSCLSMVDKDNVGIIYEGSQAHMIFQVVPLKELVQVTK